MKIVKLTVKGNRRFDLNPKSKEFVYTPMNKIQLILGDNGCGKSSLLELLLPKAVNKRDFRKGGFYRLELIHDGIEYIISTTSAKYSFIRDGVELNPRGNIKTQEALIVDYLGLTEEINSLMIGKTKFTKLGVAQRRQVLEYLSGNNYNMVNDIHQEARRRAIASKNIIGFNTRKLEEVQSELEMLNKGGNNSERISDLNERIDELLPKLKGVTSGVTSKELRDKVRRFREDVIKYNAYRDKLDRFITEKRIQAPDEIKEVIGKLRSKKQVIDAELRALYAKMELLNSHVTKTHEVEEAKQELKEIKEKISKISSIAPKNNKFYTPKPQATMDSLNMLRDLIVEVGEIDDATVRSLSGSQITEQQVAVEEEMLASTEKEFEDFRERLTILDDRASHEKQKCPKCKHEFVSGYDAQEHEAIREWFIELRDNKLPVQRKHFEQLRTMYENQVIATGMMRELRVALDNMSLTEELSSELKSLIYNDPKQIPSVMESFYHYTEQRRKFGELVKRGSKLKDVIVASSTAAKQALSNVGDAETLKRSIDRHLIHLKKLTSRINTLDQALSMVARRDMMLNKVQEDIEVIANEMNDFVLAKRDALLQEKIHQLRTRHFALVTADNTRRNLISRIKELRDDIEAESVKLHDAQLLMRCLNPKGSLVAKTISGFINEFIGGINTLLSGLWEYQLEVCTLSDTEEGLNYRFPFVAKGKKKDDISLASTATADAIDLSFKLATMNMLGLDDYPIYLDELGAGWDVRHLENLCGLISKRLYQLHNNNIFIVAHQPQLYKYFTDDKADISVLSDTNMDVKCKDNKVLNFI